MFTITNNKLDIKFKFKFNPRKKYQTDDLLDFLDHSRMLDDMSERRKVAKSFQNQ